MFFQLLCYLIDYRVIPLAASSYLTRVKYVGSGYPNEATPPEVDVL